MGGKHGGSVVSTAASQQEGPGFDSQLGQGLGLSVWSLHVLPVLAWVSSGHSGFLPHQKNMYIYMSVHLFVISVCLSYLYGDNGWKLAAGYNLVCLHSCI